MSTSSIFPHATEIDDGQELRGASPINLTSTTGTPQANAVVFWALGAVIEAGAIKRASANHTVTLAALLGGLAREQGRTVLRITLDRDAYTGHRLSCASMTAMLRGLRDTGFIDGRADHGFDKAGPHEQKQRYQTRIWAREKLSDLFEEHGITPDNAQEHFPRAENAKQPKPPKRTVTGRKVDTVAFPIELKQITSRPEEGGPKPRGKNLDFDQNDPKVKALAADVERLNTFWRGHALETQEGPEHPVFVRVFHRPSMARPEQSGWDKHGRLYSDYMRLGNKNGERSRWTIDGEAVAEIDIRASYLTIFQAKDLPLDPETDPYHVSDIDTGLGPGPAQFLPREVVKAYIATTFGQGRAPGRWGEKAVKDWQKAAEGDTDAKLGWLDAVATAADPLAGIEAAYPLDHVAQAVHTVYPALAKLNEPEAWSQLMFTESQVILKTVLGLIVQNIPVLPIHDALVVPASKVATARSLLQDNFGLIVGVWPALKITAPPRAMTGTAHDWDF